MNNKVELQLPVLNPEYIEQILFGWIFFLGCPYCTNGIKTRLGSPVTLDRLSFHHNTFFGYMKQKTAMKQLTSTNKCFETFVS